MIQPIVKSNIWVIVPAYNEEKYISGVLNKLKKVCPNIVVVNDGSSDRTAKIAQKLISNVISHPVNLGKGAAMKTGCDYVFKTKNSTGVIFFDADDQHDSRLIATMAAELQNSPVVLGVRAFNNQMPLIKILFNRLASFIILIFFGEYIPDIPSGFKAISKEAYKAVRWTSRDYLVEMEIAAKVAQKKIKFSTVAIPTIYLDLDRGMTVLDILHMAGKILSWKVSR